MLGTDDRSATIACHFANAGLQVLLLGMPGKGDDLKSRNKPAVDALTSALKSKPSPIYSRHFINQIATGNFGQDMSKIADCDWVIDAMADNPDMKQKMFEQVDQFRKPGSLITFTTPGAAIHPLAEGRSTDFRENLCGMQFSGLLRYSQSLEIAPTEETLPEVVDFLMFYGEKYLGKATILVKNTSGVVKVQDDIMYPDANEVSVLENIRSTRTLWKNEGASIFDLGDGIINLEFHTEKNIITSEVIAGINHAVSLAEQNYNGLVIYNEGTNFSEGSDVAMLFALASKQKFDEINTIIKSFQDAILRIRYSSIPVVVAPHKTALGSGCELCLHADKIVAQAELYMGLGEINAGLIPFGGGTKEFILRLSDEIAEGDIEVNNFRRRFLTIAQAKISASAYEAFELGYLKKDRDVVIMSHRRLLAEAKKQCLLLADEGYVQPMRRTDIRVLGKLALGLGYAGANSMYIGHYISQYDMKISQKLAFIMAGGDLSQPTLVNEDYLLGMEREALISLCAEPESLERMQSILTVGEVLEN